MVRKKTRVAIYVRVSTDGQSVRNQRDQLEEIAKDAGWRVVQVYEDAGISGAKGRDRRPGFDALCKDAAARKFDLVASWSVDRLGRSLQDLIGFLGELQALGIDLYLKQQGLDTTTPSGRAMFGMLGVFAEFERSLIQERVRAGMKRAKREGRVLGRPIGSRGPVDPRRAKVLELRQQGFSLNQIVKRSGAAKSTVCKWIKEAA